MSSIGDKFQQETKYEPSRMARHRLLWDAKPALYKEYPEVQKIELPSFDPRRFAPTAGLRQQAVGAAGAMSLNRALRQRKSIRDFQQKPISKGKLSYLLWASTGIERIEDGYEFSFPQSGGPRTEPHPLELFIQSRPM